MSCYWTPQSSAAVKYPKFHLESACRFFPEFCHLREMPCIRHQPSQHHAGSAGPQAAQNCSCTGAPSERWDLHCWEMSCKVEEWERRDCRLGFVLYYSVVCFSKVAAFFFLSSLLNERNFKRNSRRQFKSSHRILDKASSHMHGSSVPLIPSTHCVSPALFPRPSVSQLVAASKDTSISSRADTKIQAFRSAGIPRRMQNLLCVPQTIWLSFPRAQQPG